MAAGNGSDRFVVVGGGLGGARTVTALREEGYDGELVLVAAESDLPYERPPLSKGYLQGSAERDSVFVHPREWYADNAVDLRLGTRATALDTAAHDLRLDGGERLRYDKLLLATGAVPRRLDAPGADLVDLRYLRTLGDSDTLRACLRPGARVAVVGGGWIGLEAAAAARGAGADVVVLEYAELPLLRVLGPEMGTVFADLHREHGVDVRTGVRIAGVKAEDKLHSTAATLVLADGSEVYADVVVVGVGVAPDVALAESAGLAVDDGVLVDASLRTSDPDVFAVGDVANAEHPLLGRRVRVEHWANALNQPATAARAMLGKPAGYERLPYFYSDQYDLGMEYTGYVAADAGAEVVVRGDAAAREFVAFWTSGGRVLAGMNVNVWDVTGPIGDLVRSGVPVDPARLADPGVPLADLAAG